MKILLFPVVLLAAIDALANVRPSFAGRLLLDAPVPMALEAKGALAPWRMMHASGMTERGDGTRDFAFTSDGAPRISGTFRVGNGAAGGADRRAVRNGDSGAAPPSVVAEWTFTPAADVRMEMFGLMGDLRMSDYGEGTAVMDGESIHLPKAGTAENIGRPAVSRLELADRNGGKRLAFAFREPVRVFIQYWGGKTMSLRFILPPDNLPTGLYHGGVARRLAFTLVGAGSCVKSTLSPIRIEAGRDWIPLAAPKEIVEGSALDFSAQRPTGKPCGKFGHVVARGAHFEFEGLPGVPQRFYGVNLCSLVNFPETPDDAKRLARTLARAGYNAVRIHHHDGYCIDRNDPAATRLDEAMMLRMDALVTACIEEGLYISTDLFVSRTRFGIPWRAVGVDHDGKMSAADFAMSVPVHDGVYSNFLAFAGNWLGHINAYTGRRYADEPAIAWLSLVNEGDIDKRGAHEFSSRPGWREAWETWLAAQKAEDPDFWRDITPAIPNGLGRDRQGRAFLRFLQEVETRFLDQTREFVRGLGCRALLTDMNDATLASAAFERVRAESCDYVDVHFYVDHPRFLEGDWALPSWCPNANPFQGETAGASVKSAVRILDRPFTVSEYNFAWPGRYRSVGGIAAGAEAALQDWAGLWRFAWAHHPEAALRPGSKPPDFFDIASDPLQLASERASVCLFLRGDAEPLETTYAVTLPLDKVSSPDALIGTSARVDWVGAAWFAKIGTVLGSAPDGGPLGDRALPDGGASRPGEPVGAARRAACNGGSGAAPPPVVHAGDFDTAYMKSLADIRRDLGIDGGAPGGRALPELGGGAVRIDRERGTFLIDTPRTCGVFAEGGAHTAGVLRVEIADIPTTIWASSLDGSPLSESSRILLTHLTDVQNTGEEFADAEMTILKARGNLPCLMRAGHADVSLAIERGSGAESPSFAVFALAPDGTRIAEMPCTNDGGALRFTADIARDPTSATYLYEIVRQ